MNQLEILYMKPIVLFFRGLYNNLEESTSAKALISCPIVMFLWSIVCDLIYPKYTMLVNVNVIREIQSLLLLLKNS